MIHFLMCIFKQPQRHSIYWALEDIRVSEQALGQPVAYRYITIDANCVADDMAKRALETRATITFWDGQVPKDAPENQLQDVYKQQGMKSQLDWVSLPESFDWMTSQPDPQSDVTVAVIFGQRYAIRVMQLFCGRVSIKPQCSSVR